MLRVSVIGSGSWGTTLANLLADKGIETTLYVRRKELYESIISNKENKSYLPGIKLSNNLKVINNLAESMHSEIILLSVPVKYMRQTLQRMAPLVKKNHLFISSSKGIENNTLMRPSSIVCDVLNIELNRVVALSGPNFAKEVANRLPTATVVAGKDEKLTQEVQKIVSCSYFRAYRSNDIVGVEIAGAIKNVMAIAAGISDGLGLGNNAKASLITRGLAEMARFGTAIGAKQETFMGLAGVGDLVLTCTGSLSRNREVGLKIAQGKTLKEILSSMIMIAEGVNTVKSIHQWAETHQVEMPISTCVYRVLYEGKKPHEAVKTLMERPLKSEL